MTREELFEIWAPPGAIWSPWVKPALFATLGSVVGEPAPRLSGTVVDTGWIPPAQSRCAVVVDLPGPAVVITGLVLAERGYQPVPLFNTTIGRRPAIAMSEIVAALVDGTALLARRALSPDAPPAFLLDSRRKRGDRTPAPGEYDNRWIVLPQDFPSANFLKAQAVSRVLLAALRQPPADDLAHVLCRWQDAGLPIWFDNPTDPRKAEQLRVCKPSGYRSLWHRAAVLIGLRRSSAGGFGAIVPEAPRGGYG